MSGVKILPVGAGLSMRADRLFCVTVERLNGLDPFQQVNDVFRICRDFDRPVDIVAEIESFDQSESWLCRDQVKHLLGGIRPEDRFVLDAEFS